MDARHIDHVNLHIPTGGVDAARTFYGEQLGFGIEDAHYDAGEKPFLDVRLSPTAVFHLRPSDDFEAPTATNFAHVCVVVEEDVEAVKSSLADAGVDVDRESASPLGATSESPSVYVTDPFGYQLELKTRA